MIVKPSPRHILQREWPLIAICLFLLTPFIYDGDLVMNEGTNGLALLIYIIICGASGYALFLFVARSFFAKLTLQNGEMVFSTLLEERRARVQTITDIGFSVNTRPALTYRNARGQDILFFSNADGSVENWKIGTGWQLQDMTRLVDVIRTRGQV